MLRNIKGKPHVTDKAGEETRRTARRWTGKNRNRRTAGTYGNLQQEKEKPVNRCEEAYVSDQAAEEQRRPGRRRMGKYPMTRRREGRGNLLPALRVMEN